MGTVPFTDADFPEVCGRVAYQMTVLAYRRRDPMAQISGPALVSQLIDQLPFPRPEMLFGALLGLNHALVTGRLTARQWRDRCVLFSRAGCTFRRCYHDEYKATRRRATSRRSR